MISSALAAGEPIPSVQPEDLRRAWELMHAQQPATGICVSLLARVCVPEADVLAVWSRSSWLGMRVAQDLLASWYRGAQLHKAVFDVAAAFPIPGFDQFDQDAFLQQLKTKAAREV